MKGIYKNAMAIGLVGALLVLCVFAVTSLVANEEIKSYETGPHDRLSDDVGFFWYLLFFGVSPFIVIGSGLMSTFLLRRLISSEKDAVIAATIASAVPCIIGTAVITGCLFISTSVGHILPYYDQMLISQSVSMSVCLTSQAFTVAISVGSAFILYKIRD
jgi:hypothetical protein